MADVAIPNSGTLRRAGMFEVHVGAMVEERSESASNQGLKFENLVIPTAQSALLKNYRSF